MFTFNVTCSSGNTAHVVVMNRRMAPGVVVDVSWSRHDTDKKDLAELEEVVCQKLAEHGIHASRKVSVVEMNEARRQKIIRSLVGDPTKKSG